MPVVPSARLQTSGGRIASASAPPQTAGVYTRAKREMNASERDLCELESSTSSRILETVDSPNSFVVRILSTPVRSMQPLMISSPSATSRGRLSPVRALVSSAAVPETTTPSSGIFSPGWTTMTLPTATSSGSTCSRDPSRSMFA